MEIKSCLAKWIRHVRLCGLAVYLLACGLRLCAQEPQKYYIRNSRMYIELRKDISNSSLDSFIAQYDLRELGLDKLIRLKQSDALKNQGWQIVSSNKDRFIISKNMEPFEGSHNSFDQFIITKNPAVLFPAVNNNIIYGINRFHNKNPFAFTESAVLFILPDHSQSHKVMLAGSFNNWKPDNLPMERTDSGWIARVALSAGKYWYKFIVDGHWISDANNELKENDGLGNINSVYFKPNQVFFLPGFASARKVVLSGSFNNWRTDELHMMKNKEGWVLPLYLSQGTHTYKFIVDGKWYEDKNNKDLLPDGHGGFNSVLQTGRQHVFFLKGFPNARQVTLSGTFNGWRTDELFMHKISGGWELPYSLGPGNYEYKFIVDGKAIADSSNVLSSVKRKTSYIIIEPNHRFLLKGYEGAKNIFLTGDFVNWDPQAFAMQKVPEGWVFNVHLSVGKHLYKFIVDGQWIIDPQNKLWEQNEYGTGNSILWIEN